MSPGLRLGASLLSAATALLLTGCLSQATVPSPPPPTTTAPVSGPSASPTVSPDSVPAATATRISIGAEYLTVLADDGSELERFDYFQPTGEVVAGLSRYLGPPVDTWFEGHNDAPAATYHDWGGLRLADTVPAGSAPYNPEHWVRITASDANGVAVVAEDGVSVGDATAPLLESGGDDLDRWTSPETGDTMITFRIDVVELPPMSGDQTTSDWSPSFAVLVMSDDGTGRITSMTAPSANFGA